MKQALCYNWLVTSLGVKSSVVTVWFLNLILKDVYIIKVIGLFLQLHGVRHAWTKGVLGWDAGRVLIFFFPLWIMAIIVKSVSPLQLYSGRLLPFTIFA